MQGSSTSASRLVRAPSRSAFLAILWLLVLPSSGLAGGWDEARKHVVDPLNAALHSHWPTELEKRDLDTLLRLYATETGTGLTWEGAQPTRTSGGEETLRWTATRGEETIRERYRALLELFPEIEGAELRIGRVDWRNPKPEGHRLTAHVIVRGRGPDGDRRQLEQHMILYVRFFDPFWEITSEEVTSRSLVSRQQPAFEWVGKASGIDDIHANELSPPFRLFGTTQNNPVRQASGVAVGDANADGCEDLVLAGSPRLAFYRSRCDGTFEDATSEAGLPASYPAAASGVVFLDYDNDGWSDLYVAAVKGGDRLFRNQGGGHFVDATRAAGLPSTSWGSMPALADYDRDGFLDIYISAMGDHYANSPRPAYDAHNAPHGILLRNLGDGRFEDVSAQAGVDSPGWDMAAVWADYDLDGWPDLYVGNEFGNNRLYRNEGDGTFSERTGEAGVADGGSTMGLDWADVDGDGDMDLFVSGMHANSGWALFHPDFPLPIAWYFRALGLFTDAVRERADRLVDKLSRGSTLFRNEGNGRFTDISDTAGVRDGQWGWGAKFFDYDNDGKLDLYAVNGFITGPLQDDV